MHSSAKCPLCRHDYYLDYTEGYGTLQDYVSEFSLIEDKGYCSRCGDAVVGDDEMQVVDDVTKRYRDAPGE